MPAIQSDSRSILLFSYSQKQLLREVNCNQIKEVFGQMRLLEAARPSKMALPTGLVNYVLRNYTTL